MNTPLRVWNIEYVDFVDNGERKARCLWTLDSNVTPEKAVVTPWFYINGPGFNVFFNALHLKPFISRSGEDFSSTDFVGVVKPDGTKTTINLRKAIPKKDALRFLEAGQDRSGIDALNNAGTSFKVLQVVLTEGPLKGKHLWAFNLDLSPEEAGDYDRGNKYFKLAEKDFKSLCGSGSWNAPDDAYIPVAVYEKIKNGTYVWHAGTPSRIGIRTETGRLMWMEFASKYTNSTSRDTWITLYGKATLGSDKESYKTRNIDPPIALTFVAGGTGRLTFDQLKEVFNEVVPKGKQKFKLLEAGSEPDGHVCLGTSPFGDYETWIDRGVYETYKVAYPDRAIPETVDQVKIIADKFGIPFAVRETKPFPETTIMTTLSADKIKNAVGKRELLPPNLRQQGTIMGGSATIIATDLGWIGADDRVPGANPYWPPTGVFAAEWLHLSAFSWGGFRDSVNYESSQDPENLIFGTSETNSLMTRYEKAWQALFTKEQAFRTKYMPTIGSLTGQLYTTTRELPYRTEAPQITEVLWANPQNLRDHHSNHAVGAFASWLCYSLHYRMTLENPSRIVYPGAMMYETMFYPFQRPFFTKIEAEADKLILKYFVKRAEMKGGGSGKLGGKSKIKAEPWEEPIGYREAEGREHWVDGYVWDGLEQKPEPGSQFDMPTGQGKKKRPIRGGKQESGKGRGDIEVEEDEEETKRSSMERRKLRNRNRGQRPDLEDETEIRLVDPQGMDGQIEDPLGRPKVQPRPENLFPSGDDSGNYHSLQDGEQIFPQFPAEGNEVQEFTMPELNLLTIQPESLGMQFERLARSPVPVVDLGRPQIDAEEEPIAERFSMAETNYLAFHPSLEIAEVNFEQATRIRTPSIHLEESQIYEMGQQEVGLFSTLGESQVTFEVETPEAQFERLSRNRASETENSQVYEDKELFLGEGVVPAGVLDRNYSSGSLGTQFESFSRNQTPAISTPQSQVYEDLDLVDASPASPASSAASSEVPPYSGAEAPPPSYEQLWAALVTGQSTVVVDGQVFEKPCLIAMDQKKHEVVEVSAGMVGSGEAGEAVILPEEERPQEQDMRVIFEQFEGEECGIQASTVGEWAAVTASSALVDGVPAFFGSGGPDAKASESNQIAEHFTFESSLVANTAISVEALPPAKVEIPPCPAGFVLSREIRLFNVLNARLLSAHGSEVTRANERVEITDELSLGLLFSGLKDTQLDIVKLTNTTITYSDRMTETQMPGLMLRTEVRLAGALEGANTVLRDVFGQTDPCVTVSGMIGMNQDWEELLAPIGFTFRSELRGMNKTLFGCVSIMNLGIDLMGSRTVRPGKEGKEGKGVERGYLLGLGMFGKAAVRMGEGAPLMVEWYLMKVQELYSMTMTLEDEDWKDVLGVTGLNLANVRFDASFSSIAGLDSVSLGIRATLTLRSGMIVLGGHYSKNDWSISASLGNISLTDISDMYEDLFGSPLMSTDIDIMFNSISIYIGNRQWAQLIFRAHCDWQRRCAISGAVDDVDVPGGIVKIHGAALDVFIGPAKKVGGRELKIAVRGTVTVKSINIDAGIYYYKGLEGKVDYTVYGVLAGDLQLAPELEGTFMDVAVKKVALIASNQDKPLLEGALDKFNYPVKNGVQICAIIESMEQIDQLTRGKPRGLVLSAVWNRGESFSFDIILPTKGLIKFNENVTSGDLELGVVVAKEPQIRIKAGLFVKVAKQMNPLNLNLELRAGFVSAVGTAWMNEMWKDPFGLGEDIEVGKLLLSIEIFYAQFASTGAISKFIFGGKLIAGSTTGKLLLEFSTTRPDQQLISANFNNLDLRNLFALCSKLTPWPVTLPPDSQLLKFSKLDFYLSTDVTIQGKHYPYGASFLADMVVFGHQAHVEAVVGKTFKIFGTIDSFEVGGLSIRGKRGPKPVIDIIIEAGKQYIKIDGGVYIEGGEASILLEIQMLPSLIFKFDLTVKFLSALELTFLAVMINGPKENPNDIDFILNAHFESNLLKELMKLANEQLRNAQRGNREWELKQRVEKAEIWKNETWERMEAIRMRVEREVSEERERMRKEEEILVKEEKETRRSYEIKTGDLARRLDETKESMQKELNELEQRKRDEDEQAMREILALKLKCNKKEQEMRERWGRVPDILAAAKAQLDRAERELDEYNQEIRWQEQVVRNASIWEVHKSWKLDSMKIVRIGLQAAYFTSSGYYKTAHAITTDQEYVATEETLRKTWEFHALRQESMRINAEDLTQEIYRLGVEKDQAIADAEEALKKVQTSSELKYAWDNAQLALRNYRGATLPILYALERRHEDFMNCAERKEFERASQEYINANVALDSFDPFKAAFLELAEAGTDLFGQVVSQMAGTVVDIKSVDIKGSLKGVMNNKPLIAVVVAVVAGVQCDPWQVDYYLGDALRFLQALWEEIKKFVFANMGVSFLLDK